MAKKSEIEGLKTREQKFKETKWDRMFVSRKQITSKAFRALKTATACQVFMIFLYKCRMEPIGISAKKRKQFRIANQGEIQFSYDEALGKWGILSGRFTRAIDELVRVGLIDIAKSGFGLQKDCTLYAISDRWEKFGSDEFITKKREKRKQHLGFARGNSYGINSTSKQSQHALITVGQRA